LDEANGVAFAPVRAAQAAFRILIVFGSICSHNERF
jgi:hypothetical protein